MLQMLQMFCLQIKQIIMSNFHPLEVVARGSETQLQVGGNLNFITYNFKGYSSSGKQKAPWPLKRPREKTSHVKVLEYRQPWCNKVTVSIHIKIT